MTMEERMILAHQAGRAISHNSDTAACISEIADKRYSTDDERLAFVAGFRGERIRYLDWLKARKAAGKI